MRITGEEGRLILGAIEAELGSTFFKRSARSEYPSARTETWQKAEQALQQEEDDRADQLRCLKKKINAYLLAESLEKKRMSVGDAFEARGHTWVVEAINNRDRPIKAICSHRGEAGHQDREHYGCSGVYFLTAELWRTWVNP